MKKFILAVLFGLFCFVGFANNKIPIEKEQNFSFVSEIPNISFEMQITQNFENAFFEKPQGNYVFYEPGAIMFFYTSNLALKKEVTHKYSKIQKSYNYRSTKNIFLSNNFAIPDINKNLSYSLSQNYILPNNCQNKFDLPIQMVPIKSYLLRLTPILPNNCQNKFDLPIQMVPIKSYLFRLTPILPIR